MIQSDIDILQNLDRRMKPSDNSQSTAMVRWEPPSKLVVAFTAAVYLLAALRITLNWSGQPRGRA